MRVDREKLLTGQLILPATPARTRDTGARMPQERSERGVGYHGPYPESALPRMLVRGAAESPDIDEFALLLQPTKDTRRNYRGIAGKLIQL